MDSTKKVEFQVLETQEDQKRSISSGRNYDYLAMRGNRFFAKDGNNLYYYEVNYQYNSLKQLLLADDNCHANLITFGEYLYWMDGDRNLRRGTLTDGKLEMLTQIDNDCNALDIGGTPYNMFWNDKEEKSLWRGGDDYSNPTSGRLRSCVRYEEDWPYEYVAADGDYVFGANLGSDYIAIYKATDIRLTFVRQFYIQSLDVQFLTASEGKIMWYQRPHNSVVWIDYTPFV